MCQSQDSVSPAISTHVSYCRWVIHSKGLTIISLNFRYASTRQQNAITGVHKVPQNVTQRPEDVIGCLTGCKLVFPDIWITLFCCSVLISWPTWWFLITSLRIKSWYFTLIFKVSLSLSKDIAPNTAPTQIFSLPLIFLSTLAFAFSSPTMSFPYISSCLNFLDKNLKSDYHFWLNNIYKCVCIL